MVKLNKKKGRRSGKRIQYNLARRSLKKKSKRNNKSKKVFMGGFLLPKSNEYDDKATISFDINNCNNQSVKITFKSHDEKKLNSDDSRNFVLLKHRVLDEKTSTPLMKTPLYEAYFKIPKIIFSLCRQKSKGDKNNLKLTVTYDNTGKNNTFDVSHNCTPSKFGSMNNMVKTQLETDATGIKDAFKNALENHTSYNDQISAFLNTYKNNLSEETIKKIKNKYGSNEEYVKESIKKAAVKAVEDVLKNKETHVVKEECDETKQLLKGMTITINPDGSVQFNKSGENTEQDMHKVINNMTMSMKNIGNNIAVITGDDENNNNVEKEKGKTAVAAPTTEKPEETLATAKNVKAKAQEEVKQKIDSTSSNEDNEKAAVDNEKSIEENVKAEAKKAVRTEIDSTSSNEENVEKNVNDVAEKKVTEELVKVAAIKAVEQAVGN